MPECPKCNEEIDHLVNYSHGWNRYIFSDDGGYSHRDFIFDDSKDDEFNCPHCGSILFVDEKIALEFLWGGATQNRRMVKTP
jgi:hypothetical protein